MPQYKRPKPRHPLEEQTTRQRQEQCISLASEDGFSKACNVLVNQPPLGHTPEVTECLKEKHPSASHPVDMTTFVNANRALVPLVDVNIVESNI